MVFFSFLFIFKAIDDDVDDDARNFRFIFAVPEIKIHTHRIHIFHKCTLASHVWDFRPGESSERGKKRRIDTKRWLALAKYWLCSTEQMGIKRLFWWNRLEIGGETHVDNNLFEWFDLHHEEAAVHLVCLPKWHCAGAKPSMRSADCCVCVRPRIGANAWICLIIIKMTMMMIFRRMCALCRRLFRTHFRLLRSSAGCKHNHGH